MKLNAFVLSLVIGITFISSFSKPSPISFMMHGEEWTFPTNVERAVKTHRLEYKPPGFYYKIFPDSCETFLRIDHENGDFDNEYQAKKVLFPRNVNTYLFRYPIREGLYDSLRVEIERIYKKKFVHTKGSLDQAMFKNVPITNPKYEFDVLKVNDDLTIGISKGRKTVVVRFMYDLSLVEQAINMRNYVR